MGRAREWFAANGARNADVLFAALLAFASLLLLAVARTFTFWQDEWRFIAADDLSVLDYLAPHNEHWSTVPMVLYHAMLGVFGLHSYIPYLALLIVIHAVAVAGFYFVARRRLSPPLAVASSTPLMLLGAGYENLYWAFQIGFVGSVAAGMWALVAFDSRHRHGGIAGAVLLVVALASSGIGLFFCVLAGVRLTLDPTRRAYLPWLVAPAVAYAAWYLAFGGSGLSGRQLATPGGVLAFTAEGFLYSVSRFSGLDVVGPPLLPIVAGLAAAALIAAVGWSWRAGSAVPVATAALVATAVMYATIGLVRAELEAGFEYRSRYVYVAAFFLMVAMVDLLRPFRGRLGFLGTFAVTAALSLVVASNVGKLAEGVGDYQFRADFTRALLEESQTSDLDPDAVPDSWPDAEQLSRALDRYGTPLRDEFFPSVVKPPSREARERAARAAAGGTEP